MPELKLARWSGIALVLTGFLYSAGGILVLVIPGGGVTSPLVPILYYLGTVVAVLAFAGLFSMISEADGGLGFLGFLLATVGAVLYSGPQWSLVAGTAGAPGWHDVWGFSMGNILLVGPAAFFVGMILLGLSARKVQELPKWAGTLLVVGSAIWFVAYFLSFVPGLLTIASLTSGFGLIWLGASRW